MLAIAQSTIRGQRIVQRTDVGAFILRRLIGLLLVVIGVAAATFFMVRAIPGDPGELLAGIGAGSGEVQQVRHVLGLDRPVLEQLLLYYQHLAVGDFGRSFVTKEPVALIIRHHLGPTLQVASLSLLVVLLLSVPGGLLAGALTRDSQRRRLEILFMSTTSIVGALPEFLAATFLAFLFAVSLRWLPVAGDVGWLSLILPVAAMSLRPAGTLVRIVRLETLNVLRQDYMRTARSKPLPARILYVRHALPNVLAATLSVAGLAFTNLLGSAVIVENVFARPGLGTDLVNAIVTRDYPVIQGVIIVFGIAVVTMTTIVDFVVAAFDPRSLTGRT
jgi:peptide/nickel transport system permease protein